MNFKTLHYLREHHNFTLDTTTLLSDNIVIYNENYRIIYDVKNNIYNIRNISKNKLSLYYNSADFLKALNKILLQEKLKKLL